ncbi:FUSC family protein [Streptomyces sp. NPDC050145]|uniref:FUSC family protein n=1 Tax=Streptomyces sp. NPDC050145 TaxID=3365602 RepID=UPI0037973B8E
MVGAMLGRVWQRVRGRLWPIVQQAVACGLSWWVARILFDHHVPVFAPIATVVALNTQRGGRGTNAVRVVFGVVAGVFIGQAAYDVLGRGSGAVAIGGAVLLALLVALVLDGERVTMAQAAVSAVVVVAAGQPAGLDRIWDVLVGAGVALVFSQLLFPVHPLRLLSGAETAALQGLSGLLLLGARTAGGTGPDGTLPPRPVYELLQDVDQARTDMISIARRTPRWRRHQRSVTALSTAALHLDLLGNSCVSLARATADAGPEARGWLVPAVKSLAEVLEACATAPAGSDGRQGCVRAALAVAGRVTADAGAAGEAVRLVVRDLLVVAGVSVGDAMTAVRDGASDAPLVPAP